MAQSVGAVALDIVMGKNTVSSVVGQAMREVQKTVGDASATLGQKVSSVGSAVTSMGAAVMPTSAAMTALGGSCVKTAANFESAMSEVQAISGATGKDFDALKDKAQEMGAKTKFSASQSAEAMTYMAMAGWKTEDMLGGISGIMNLAAASGEDLATTSDIVTDALTAFGKSAKDSGELADIMAAASSNANTNVYMMGETFKYAAPVAGALGYTMQDTALAIGLMANAGIKGSQAGTALRSMFSRLASPPKECAEAMEALGISITNADGTMKPFRQVIDELREKFAGLSEAEQAQYAKSLAGQEAMSGLLAIVNAAPSDVDKLTSAIDNSNGAAEKMANIMNDNLNGKITLLKSQLEGLAIEIGTSLTPMMDGVISAVSKVATWFGNLDDSTKQMVITIGLVVAAAGPVLLIVGKTISIVGGAISAISTIAGAVSGFVGLLSGTVMPAISGFFAFLLANPIVLVITAIVAAGALLIANWDKVKEVAGNLKEGIVNAWNNIKEKTSEAWENVKQKTSEAWDAISGVIQNVWNAIVGFFQSAWNTISGIIQNIWNTIVSAWNSIYETVRPLLEAFKYLFETIFQAIFIIAQRIWTSITQTIVDIWNKFVAGITTIMNTIKSVFDTVWNAIKSVVTAVVNEIMSVVTSVWNAIKSVITTVMNTIKSVISTVWNTIKGIVTSVLNSVKSFISNAMNTIKSTISNIWNSIKVATGNAINGIYNTIKNGFNNAVDFIKGLAKSAYTWGADMINGIAKGIKDTIGKVADAVNGVADKIRAKLHFSRPDEGPLREYETWMPDFVQGMANGIESNKYKLVNAVQGMASDMRIGVPALSAPALKNVGTYNQPVQTNTESNGNLLGLLTQLVESMQGNSGDITIPIYLGNDLIDERIVSANDRRTLRSGGRA